MALGNEANSIDMDHLLQGEWSNLMKIVYLIVSQHVRLLLVFGMAHWPPLVHCHWPAGQLLLQHGWAGWPERRLWAVVRVCRVVQTIKRSTDAGPHNPWCIAATRESILAFLLQMSAERRGIVPILPSLPSQTGGWQDPLGLLGQF